MSCCSPTTFFCVVMLVLLIAWVLLPLSLPVGRPSSSFCCFPCSPRLGRAAYPTLSFFSCTHCLYFCFRHNSLLVLWRKQPTPTRERKAAPPNRRDGGNSSTLRHSENAGNRIKTLKRRKPRAPRTPRTPPYPSLPPRKGLF